MGIRILERSINMKVMYQTPDIKVIKFDLEGKVMDGLGEDMEGDILEMPTLWQSEASANDTSVLE